MSDYRPRPDDHLVEPMFAALEARDERPRTPRTPRSGILPWIVLALVGLASLWLALAS